MRVKLAAKLLVIAWTLMRRCTVNDGLSCRLFDGEDWMGLVEHLDQPRPG
jgi:hypothetical protein